MRINNLDLPATTQSTPLKVYCDAARGKDDFCTVGWVYTDHNGAFADEGGCELGKQPDSVQAEMEAIKRSLSVLDGYNHVNHVKVYTDCQPVLNHLDEETLGVGFENLTLNWIERGQNKLADLIADKYMAASSQSSDVVKSVAPFGSTD